MVVPGYRRRHPPEGTVRADRRSRDPLGAAASRSSQAAVGCWAGMRGGSPGAAGRPQRASLAADVLRPTRAPVPYLPHQPSYHKRVKAAAPLICRATMFLAAACPPWASELRLLDAPGAVRRLPADR